MEKSKKAVEGAQPGIHQKEQGKETHNSLENDNPVTRKELAKASEILGKRTSSRTSSPARSKRTASSAAKKENHGAKTGISEVSDEINPQEIELMEETDQVGYMDSENEKNRGDHPSSDENWKDWEEGNSSPGEAERDSAPAKDLENLKRKAEKAEKKVAKLKKKLKKAKKKEVKKNKLKILKDKIIKANVKLKRRMKKLKKANE